MGQTSYQWQDECLERWMDRGGRGLVQAVTGSGKTRLALCAIHALEEKIGRDVLVKIVVPTSALMRQWERALREYLAEMEDVSDRGGVASAVNGRNSGSDENIRREDGRNRISLRGGGRKGPTDRKYMIYVINSARYELARQILMQLESGEAVLLIADECHHYASGENQLIFEFLTRIDPAKADYYSLGLSATLPSGQDGRVLTEALGPRIYSYGMRMASAMKTVCPFDIFHISLKFQREEREEYEELTEKIQICYNWLRKVVPDLGRLSQKERFQELRRLSAGKDRQLARKALNYMNLTYKRKSLVCLASARISCAEELIRRIDPAEKILIFGERIAQAEDLYRILYQHYPGRVGRCHSEMGEQANRNNLERFRTGEFRMLLTCKSLDEGVDIPDASVGIILSGTSAQRQRTQRLGRIIRKLEGKKRAALYYLHIGETSEDICYLPGAGENRLFEICYESSYRNFKNFEYDRASMAVLDEMRNAERKTLREVKRCLDCGRVRGDWMERRDEIQRRINAASTVEERNYWICMKKMAAEIQRIRSF
ncbi:MAG: DEAD/DEAH box helicase family protein [Lachnospiraceae bacterium]|nr:DEAD/DEAH box helicase family protein [Lachnospiraceae bacterium]